MLDVWYSEAGKFTPELKVKILKNRDDINVDHIQNNIDILVLNYAQLRVCGEELNGIKWLTTILDEGQQIKNPDSKAAKCARELDSQNRLVLTGTPIENRLLDMWSLMAFAMPGVLGSRAYFKKRFDKRKDPLSQTPPRLAPASVPAPPHQAAGRPGPSAADRRGGLLEDGRHPGGALQERAQAHPEGAC